MLPNHNIFWKYETPQSKEKNEVKNMTKKENEKPVIFFRLSKKKDHIYGFVPEGGIKEGHSIVIAIEDKKWEDGNVTEGLRSLVNGRIEFIKASILEPLSDKEKKNIEEDVEEEF